MPNEMKVSVITVTQVTRLDQKGQAVPYMRVEYRVGDHGPYALEVTKAEFTGTHVRELLEAEASEVRNLLA